MRREVIVAGAVVTGADERPPAGRAPTTGRAPRIGLALGGGSARGWAHIGVIRELVAAGIGIDVIAGTSIGAVVGACHAAGKLDQLEAFARRLNRRRVFGLIDISFGGTGLVAGARLERRLSRDLGGLRIERLPMPFAAVATELGSGREVPIVAGDLVEAMRASYALPGIFQPVPVAGCWLFDGAMSNPVPVSVCRSLGADFVIAVNLTATPSGGEDDHAASFHADRLGDAEFEALAAHADGDVAEGEALAALSGEHGLDPEIVARSPKRGALRRRLMSARRRLFTRRPDGAPGIARVVVGAFSIAQERISRSRLAVDPPDAMIYARLSSVGLFDFHRAADLVEHGRSATRAILPEIVAGLASAGRPGITPSRYIREAPTAPAPFVPGDI